MVTNKTQRIRAFDFAITYEYCPDDSVYQEIRPDELFIDVELPEYFDDLSLAEQTSVLKDTVIEELEEQVTFDTPDYPEFAITDVSFCFEKVDIISE
jgi:hypothetical protein